MYFDQLFSFSYFLSIHILSINILYMVFVSDDITNTFALCNGDSFTVKQGKYKYMYLEIYTKNGDIPNIRLLKQL